MSPDRPLLRVITAAYPGPTEPRRAHFVQGIHRGLADRYRTEVVTPRIHPGDPASEIGADGISVTRFPYPVPGQTPKQAGLGPVALARYLWAGRHAALASTSTERLGAVVAHWVVPSGWIGRAVARRARRPLILVAHGSDLTKYAATRGVRKIAGSILRSARVTICASEELAGLARSISGRAIDTRVVPVGVESCFVQNEPSALDDDSPAERETRLLFVGDLLPSKGVDQLLEAVHNLRSSGVELSLELYGDGPLRGEASSPGITWRGVASPEEIARAMGRSDALVLPSEREGTPVVVQEAIVRRLPVIATAVGGVPALFAAREGWTRLLSNSVEELGRALREFDRRRRAGDHPREAMADNEVDSLRLDRTVERFAEILDEVMV